MSSPFDFEFKEGLRKNQYFPVSNNNRIHLQIIIHCAASLVKLRKTFCNREVDERNYISAWYHQHEGCELIQRMHNMNQPEKTQDPFYQIKGTLNCVAATQRYVIPFQRIRVPGATCFTRLKFRCSLQEQVSTFE